MFRILLLLLVSWPIVFRICSFTLKVPSSVMTVCLTYIHTCKLDSEQCARSHRPISQVWACPSAGNSGWRGLRIQGWLLVGFPRVQADWCGCVFGDRPPLSMSRRFSLAFLAIYGVSIERLRAREGVLVCLSQVIWLRYCSSNSKNINPHSSFWHM